MKFTIDHFNINVLDLEKSLDFYERALGLKEVKRKKADDGSSFVRFKRPAEPGGRFVQPQRVNQVLGLQVFDRQRLRQRTESQHAGSQ